jgi:hypothetical protein
MKLVCRRYQHCPAACFMAFVGDLKSINGMFFFAFYDGANATVPLDRTSAFIPDTCNGFSIDGEMRRTAACHFPAVACGIA